jgi:hydrogenase maturation protease
MHLIGYGNPGRGDDGLGPVFAANMAARSLPGLIVSTDYQLTVDHALEIAGAGRVVFVDALMRSDAPFHFSAVEASPPHDMTSHSLSPAAVLALAATLYNAHPEAYVLGISGWQFGEVKEGLSPEAKRNLSLAEDAFLRWFDDQQDAAMVHQCGTS